LLYLTYTFTAEARREKENARFVAAERAEQRKKKKANLQQKAAQREWAGNNNKRTRKLIMFILFFLIHDAHTRFYISALDFNPVRGRDTITGRDPTVCASSPYRKDTCS
jgi:hypothetical protein